MDTIEEAVAALAALSTEQGLRERALALGREVLETTAADERQLDLPQLAGWSPEEIELRFERCALVFRHASIEYPFVDTQIGLFAKVDGAEDLGLDLEADGLTRIGSYRLITRLDGEVDDDYLEFEVEKA